MNQKQIQELAGHRRVSPWIAKLVQDAVLAEREACAKVCESFKTNEDGYIDDDWADMCAAAIRARGE